MDFGTSDCPSVLVFEVFKYQLNFNGYIGQKPYIRRGISTLREGWGGVGKENHLPHELLEVLCEPKCLFQIAVQVRSTTSAAGYGKAEYVCVWQVQQAYCDIRPYDEIVEDS